MPNLDEALVGFTGRVPLFPLPGTVFFPNVLLPLHVFEERYRAMVADAVEGERLIAVGLLHAGFEPYYQTKHAPLHDTVCVGRITAEQRLPDGRYHLVLRGLSRARLDGEFDTDDPYRIGRLKLLTDVHAPEPEVDREVRRAELLWTLRRALGPDFEQALHRALDDSVPLGLLCDVIAFTIGMEAERKQVLLDELDVDRRSTELLTILRAMAAAGTDDPGFPPAFSLN